ncbi:DUF6896 domain-containing protein [Urbifossiella limnaea]|uniref:DUF6896 domain-containing protein n=1 Tax=Urbifossiella limnaea TaxID=2528023 RepID=A0A517XWP2_9BACT|nr:hypothetical protein [Urbifossiella limnaea]QDU21923.1 hypothetical protein ETAA1_38960 [Urbifossiella limnaea]
MDARLDALLAALTRVDAPFDVRHLPEPGALPSPWETWTLIGLARHRGRQFWVADLVRTRLRGAPTDLAAAGALGHPEAVPQLGPVPGMPEWEYYFHGRGCRVTHKVDGESIDVDFYGETAEYFDTYFYKNYLESLRRPEPPEERLLALHPSPRTISLAIASLLAAGGLTPFEGRDSHPYRLADGVIDALDAIDAFCAAWEDPSRRPRLAALIGDWPAAEETAPRAERCRELWRQRVRRDLKVPFVGADALQALADLNSPDLDRHLEDALREPPSGIVSAALAVIGKADDPKWCDRVYALFSRVDPSGPLPQPHIWMTSLKYLLRHGYRKAEMTTALAKAGRTEVGEAVLVALEHAPELALPLIRRGLISEVPIDRTEVAAILTLVGKPWSLQELLGALKASDDQERTADARAALLETGDPEAERAVLEWEEMNPHENETGSYLEIGGRCLGPFYSMGEHVLRNRGEYVRYEMGKLHDRVMKLRNVVPPEPPAPSPWWKFWAG